MEKIYIMTWNTQLYVENTLMPICKKYRSVINVIKGFLEGRNAICFLQEIPYLSNANWKEHTLYSELNKDFPDNEYDVIFNEGKQIMMTIAIAKKSIITKSECDSFNNNRTVTIRYKDKDIVITGIHAFNGKDNKKYLKSLDSCHSNIILGDFNAGNYEESENRDVFNSILKEHTCICNKNTRRCKYRFTPIDHIFVNMKGVSKYTECTVHEEIECSDHYPITFDIEYE